MHTGLFTHNGNNCISYIFLCDVIVDPVIGIEDFKETPEIVSLDETDTTDKFFNKISTTMKRMVSRMWLCHHPQLRYVN